MYNISHTNNVREIDIEMSDNEEYNVNNSPFTTPNYIGSEDPNKSSTNNPIQKPNPKANTNTNTNINTNPKPNPKLKPSTNNLQPNPFQKPNPNPNPNPKFPAKRNPRPFNHRNLLPQYICNITNNQVSRNPHQNRDGPRVLLYNPNHHFSNPSYNPTNHLGHTFPSCAAEATYPPGTHVRHPHIERNSNQHIFASHEPHLPPTHYHYTSPKFGFEGYKRDKREPRSYFNNDYTYHDGGRLSHHHNGGHMSRDDKYPTCQDEGYIQHEGRTSDGSGDKREPRSYFNNDYTYHDGGRLSHHHNGGYMSRDDKYPTCRDEGYIQHEGRTSDGSGTRDNRRKPLYPHGGRTSDGSGTNGFARFPLSPPPPPLLPTPPLQTISNVPPHFPYAFNPNYIPPPPSSLLPTNFIHAHPFSINFPRTPPPKFNYTPTHFPLFPPNNPHNISLFSNYTPPSYQAFPTHTPPFIAHNSPSTSNRFQYSTPPSKFPPHEYEIPHRKHPIRTQNNHPLPTKPKTFQCNNVRAKNV